jgi:putative ABC transport system permease protein
MEAKMMDNFLKDIRYAARVLTKNAGMTAIMVFTLALAIGATTAIFSVVYGVLLRPLPYPNPDRIVALFEVNYKGGNMNLADPNFNDLRALNRSLQAAAEYAMEVTSISGGAEPVRAGIGEVSADFFKAIGVQPAIGRGFVAEDQRRGAAPVALVSYDYWRQSLGGSTNFSQFKLKIEDRVYSVVGVMPAGFHYPPDTDVWFPRELDEINTSRTAHNWRGIGRLQDGVTLAQARADVAAVGIRVGQQYGEGGNFSMRGFNLMPLQDSMTGRSRPALLILLGAVGFLLLVACANIANLLLSQASARERELAIRTALGANRGRLVRQFLTEAMLLCLLAGGLAVLAAWWGVNTLLALAPKDLPRLDSISINVPVLLFALGISFAVAVGLGLFTALRATSGEPRDALAEGGRDQAGTQSSQRIGRAIVMAQVAITLVLLVGAGLLGRSLLRVLSVDPGFRTERVLTMDLAMPLGDDPASKIRQLGFINALFERLRVVPGVEEVGGASDLPLDGGLSDGMFVELNPSDVPKRMEDFEKLFKDTSRTGEADYCAASDGYFRALGIPLIRGRMFDERDTESAPHVALISESLARVRWPNQDPLGHTLEFGNMDGDLRLLTIIGVVGDTHEYSLETPARPTIYVDIRQRPKGYFTVVMRADTDPSSVFSAARGIMRELAPDVPPRFRTFSQVYSASLGSRRFNLTLVGVFAGTALLLAMAGIYGVIAYSVTRRTREIGVRMALGASPVNVLRMVLGQGMRTAAMGVVIGIAGSLMLTRTMQSLLFGVTATDPLTFAAVALALAAVALLACYLPARRATRVDPMVALRHE